MVKRKKDTHKQQLRKLARDSRAQGNYYQVKKADFNVMSRDAVFFIAFLADLEKRAKWDSNKRKKMFTGWMFCTIPYAEQELKMGRTMQNRIIRELIEKKFINTKLKGVPPKRFFYVYWENIEEAVQEYGESNHTGETLSEDEDFEV